MVKKDARLKVNKVVLAYSGGLDTSVIRKWLIETYQAEVIAFAADVGQGDIFVLVDALGNRDGRKALGMLHRLLEYQEYYTLFGMVVRQFRMILLTRDLLDHGGGNDEITRGLKLYNRPWLAGKYIAQARRFTPHDLRRIYRRLLEVDEAVKSSQMTGDLALETLAASLTI